MARVNYTLELVQLKYQVMKKRIETLRNAFGVVQDSEISQKGIQKLDELEMQYDRMYEAMLQQQNYASYEEIEKSIVSYLARLDVKLDEYVYCRKDKLGQDISDYLSELKNTENYQDFKNMNEILNKISGLEELVRRYSGYCRKELLEALQTLILNSKFECLLRAQVELMLEGKR